MNYATSLLIFDPHHTSRLKYAYLTTYTTWYLPPFYQQRGSLIRLCPCFSQTHFGSTGISTSCPSPTALRPRLRSRLTLEDEPSQEPSFERQRFSLWSRYSYRHSLSYTVHSALRYCFCPYTMLLYHVHCCTSLASVVYFSPGHLRRRITRPVSYYALFK